MARIGIAGLECGDTSEFTPVATFAIATDQKKTGSYSIKSSGGGGTARLAVTASNTAYPKVHVRFTNSGNPATPTTWNDILYASSSPNVGSEIMGRVQARGNASGGFDLRLVDSAGAVIGSSTNVAIDAWHAVEMYVLRAAGAAGTLTLKVNGSTIATSTSCTTRDETIIGVVLVGVSSTAGDVGTGFSVWFDNISVDDAAFPGATEIVRLPIVSTAPTHNAWTKSTGSTIDTVWNDVPFGTGTSANSGSTLGTPSQTARVDSSGLASSVTVNGTGFGLIGTTSAGTQNGGVFSFREIVNGSTVDTVAADNLTTANLYRSRVIAAVPTYAQLATIEAGTIKGASGQARTQTIHDLWLSVDYTPGASGDIAGSSTPTFSNTATLTGAGALAGTSSPTFAPTAVLTGAASIAGTSTPAFAPTATLTAAGVLAGTALPAFTNTATLTATGALAGAAALSFTNEATLISGDIFGTSTVAFANTGTLTGVGVLAGVVAVSFTNSAVLTAPGVLAGQSDLAFSNTAALTGAGVLAGAVTPAFSNTAALAGAGALAGVATPVFTNTAVLAGSGALAGASSPVFTNTAVLAGSGALAGASSPVFAPTGVLSGGADGAIFGTADLSFSLQAEMTATAELAGVVSFSFLPTGEISQGPGRIVKWTPALNWRQRRRR